MPTSQQSEKDDIGLDLHFLQRIKSRLQVNTCNRLLIGLFPGLKKCPPDTFLRPLAVALFESLPAKTKKKDHPFGWSFFLVDDIGLEPMTFRTSSGCSSQLS